MYGVVLIVVLVITGGVIAFIGDRVGTKVGKKKLSIFGLRPRHTSVIITIITGVCITTLTFGVLAAVSKNVRTALFGMEQLNQSMRETQERLNTAGVKLAAAEEQQKKAENKLKDSQQEIDKLQDKQEKLAARASELEAGNAALEREKGELLAQNDSLAEANTSLKSDNVELEKRSEALREGLQIIREGEIAFRAGEIVASGVIEGNRPLADVHADMESLISLANRNTAQRLGTNDENSCIWIYQPEYDKAVETISQGKTDMVVRIVAAGNLVAGEPVRTNLQLFKNSIIYRRNEFIIARPFHITAGDGAEAEHTVMSFLKDVNQAATDRGILPDPIRGSVGVMEGSQFFDIVQALTPISGDIILSAYAREDTDALGPLRLNLKLESDFKAEH
ncbi:MAG: DUF3084 domain-containing protein [Schwartzia sp.]|nr:DUF3084 domain-containing protein [Schwartzia sp. (in: firmicutes)]